MKSETTKMLKALALDAVGNGWSTDSDNVRELVIAALEACDDSTDFEGAADVFQRELDRLQSNSDEVLVEIAKKERIGLRRIRAGADWSDGAYEVISSGLYITIPERGEFDVIRRREVEGEFDDEVVAQESSAAAALKKARK